MTKATVLVASMVDTPLTITVTLRKGTMGGAPYFGRRVGGGPIFEVSVSQLDTKLCPGKLPTGSSYFE